MACCETNLSEAICYICSLKKKIKHYEEEFEREYGYRPSHADKMGDKGIKKMYAEMNRLRKEVKRKSSEQTLTWSDVEYCCLLRCDASEFGRYISVCATHHDIRVLHLLPTEAQIPYYGSLRRTVHEQGPTYSL
jgi:hypothetical protein